MALWVHYLSATEKARETRGCKGSRRGVDDRRYFPATILKKQAESQRYDHDHPEHMSFVCVCSLPYWFLFPGISDTCWFLFSFVLLVIVHVADAVPRRSCAHPNPYASPSTQCRAVHTQTCMRACYRTWTRMSGDMSV